MTDIVQRLRESVTQARALDRAALLTEAAGEIERLRAGLIDDEMLSSFGLVRLTDAEREAIQQAIYCCEDITYGGAANQEAADVLNALLGRLK